MTREELTLVFEQAKKSDDFDIIYHVEENTWNNITSIQLNVKDIKFNDIISND